MSTLSLFDVEQMSSAEYRKNLENPEFRAHVEKLTRSANPVVVNEEPEIVPPAVIPAVVPLAPVSNELPEQSFSWQPKDEHGRPMGGLQVIKYKTQEEKDEKFVKANNSLLIELRKRVREQRLGLTPEENIPTEAQRFDGIVEFKPKSLTAEERFQITQDLNDPEKFDDARDRLLESAIGVPPSKLISILNSQQMESLQLRAKQNFDTFIASGPDFYADAENTKTLTDWMFKNKLAPTVDNFNLASSTLKAAGLLLDAPVVRQEPVPTLAPASVLPVEPEVKAQPLVVPPSRIAPEVQPQPKRHSQVPSGLNDRISSATGLSPAEGHSLTLADIDRMSGDQYKAKMKDPAFRKLVDTLEKEAALKRQQRNG